MEGDMASSYSSAHFSRSSPDLQLVAKGLQRELRLRTSNVGEGRHQLIVAGGQSQERCFGKAVEKKRSGDEVVQVSVVSGTSSGSSCSSHSLRPPQSSAMQRGTNAMEESIAEGRLSDDPLMFPLHHLKKAKYGPPLTKYGRPLIIPKRSPPSLWVVVDMAHFKETVQKLTGTRTIQPTDCSPIRLETSQNWELRVQAQSVRPETVRHIAPHIALPLQAIDVDPGEISMHHSSSLGERPSLPSTQDGAEQLLTFDQEIESQATVHDENVGHLCSETIAGKNLGHLAGCLGKGHVCNVQELLFQDSRWGEGDDGFDKVTEAIASGNLKSLKKLDLSGSTGNVGKSLGAALVLALVKGHVHSLQELLLSDIKMGDGEIVNLAEAIESGSFPQLETLDVSGTKECEESSLAKLTYAIGKGRTMQMKRLILRNTGLGNVGAYQLAQAIESGKLPSLEALDVTGNPRIDSFTNRVLLASWGKTCERGLLVDAPTLIQDIEVTSALRNLVAVQGSQPDRLREIDDVVQTGHPEVPSTSPSTSLAQRKESLSSHSQSAQPMKEAWADAPLEKKEPSHEESVVHRHEDEDLNNGAGMTIQQGDRWAYSSELGHAFSEDDHMSKSGDNPGFAAENVGNGFRLGSINESQLRQDVQHLGFKSWDDTWEPGCMLVLGDVTSSDEQLHFVFFHTKAMVRLFGCGLPYSKVTILLDERLIWIQEMMEESWKAVWMSSYMGQFRPFLLEEARTGEENNSKDSKVEVLHLDKNEALSKVGLSVDGPHLQQFVKSSGSTACASTGSKWEPTWISWLRSVINHAFVDGSVPEQLNRKMEDLSVKSPLGTALRLKGKETRKEIVADETEEAIPKLHHETERCEGHERKLVVMVTFSRPVCPFFEYSSDRESAKEITHNSTVPERLSYIQPQFMVEFFCKEEEKCVSTTLDVKYQMRIQGDRWPRGWLQNDLRLSLGSKDREAFLKNHGIKRTELVKSDTTRQMGGSSSDQWGASGEGSVQIPVVSIGGKGTGQWGSTGQMTWSDQNKSTRRKRVLESDDCFGVSGHSYDSTMEGRAFFWPAEDPTTYWEPEYRFDQSALRSDVGMEAEAEWELLGKGIHEYIFEASKELTKCTKAVQEHDEERPSKWLKMAFGKSATRSSGLQDQQGAKVTQERILQMFWKKFLLNHNFDDFFVRYERSGAYKWNILDESPVYRALRDERVTSGEEFP